MCGRDGCFDRRRPVPAPAVRNAPTGLPGHAAGNSPLQDAASGTAPGRRTHPASARRPDRPGTAVIPPRLLRSPLGQEPCQRQARTCHAGIPAHGIAQRRGHASIRAADTASTAASAQRSTRTGARVATRLPSTTPGTDPHSKDPSSAASTAPMNQ